jgi:AcrR family transcriptional regulator
MLTVFTAVNGVYQIETGADMADMPVGAPGAAGTRRERFRDATTAEIKTTARQLLIADGPTALTLRAIAREMGLTAPALYRYFDSHEELVAGLCEDILAEITATLEQARDTVGTDDPIGRLQALCRAFRRWGLDHPREFQLVFATVGEGKPPGHDEVNEDLSFGAVFLGVFAEIWQAGLFVALPDEELPEVLAGQLRTFSSYIGDVLPLGVLAAFLGGWVRLFGAVTIEVFGHLGFALTDAEPMFEVMLADMCSGITNRPR